MGKDKEIETPLTKHAELLTKCRRLISSFSTAKLAFALGSLSLIQDAIIIDDLPASMRKQPLEVLERADKLIDLISKEFKVDRDSLFKYTNRRLPQLVITRQAIYYFLAHEYRLTSEQIGKLVRPEKPPHKQTIITAKNTFADYISPKIRDIKAVEVHNRILTLIEKV